MRLCRLAALHTYCLKYSGQLGANESDVSKETKHLGLEVHEASLPTRMKAISCAANAAGATTGKTLKTTSSGCPIV